MTRAPAMQEQQQQEPDDGRRACRHCHVSSLLLDWSAGDVVCTNCGVVNEEHVCDTGPEWRDFAQDQNETGNAISTRARCGMVPIDEGRFLGGLEPTRLSKHVFGANHHNGYSQHDAIRKRLTKTNRQVDALMVRQYTKALKEAKISRQVQRKHYDNTELMTTTDVRPDHDLQLDHEEEHAVLTQAALVTEKWSIQRAILLHGTPQEQSTSLQPFDDQERQDLFQQMDKPLKTAAADLYCAYSLLQRACQSLHLPHRVSHEATTMLCRYAARRNGFHVKGVSSRISKTKKQPSTATAREESAERLREWNKRKQITSLVCALLFLTARNLGWTRSLQEVCNAGKDCDDESTKGNIIKTKHACKAIAEIKSTFPDYARSISTHLYNNGNPIQNQDTDRFVEHATRKLDLPPVALACIRLLVSKESNASNGTKLSIICASFTHFVCLAGDTMQRLALQAQQQQEKKSTSRKRKRIALGGKQQRCKADKQFSVVLNSETERDTDNVQEATENVGKRTSRCSTGSAPAFDVFSHTPIQHDPTAKIEYEMRRMWDAWTEQMTWSRGISLIESAWGVSKRAIDDHYKQNVHPRKLELLQALQACESSPLREAPLASVLLSNITAAAPLMKSL